MRRVDSQDVESILHHLEPSVLPEGFVHGPEEVEPEERVFVAPFANGLAAFGGDEAAAGSADFNIKICVVGN